MLLHGDVFLNEGVEVGVRVDGGCWGGVCRNLACLLKKLSNFQIILLRKLFRPS